MECVPSFPMNIKATNQKGNCNIKCKLECNYHNSVCNVTNKDTYLSLSYDTVPVPPVKFNDVDLDVKEIRIYSPSLHQYEGNEEDAEMVILHKGNGEHMAVCVPIKINDDSSDNIINEIINKCSTLIPNEDETTTLTLTDYNLTHFVPMDSPFLHYACSIPFDCAVTYQACVFGNKQQYIPITSSNLFALKSIIREHGMTTYPDIPYFTNPTGITKKLSNTYVRCYKKDALPEDLKEIHALKKGSIPSMEEEVTEGFINMNQIIDDKRSIHIGTLIVGFLSIIGGFYFLKQTMSKKR